MNRLFWKFFLSFWLALGLMLVVLHVALTLYNDAQQLKSASIDRGGRTEFALHQLALVIRHVSDEELHSILKDKVTNAMPTPLVVDEQGRDLLDRPVNAEILAQARTLLREQSDPGAVRQENARSGKRYLIFQPVDGLRAPESVRPPRGVNAPLAFLVAALIACLGVCALLARHFARPIQNLRDAFRAVAEGRLDTRIGASMGRRRDEIAQLGVEFDKMTERLEQSVSVQKRLLHDVSHELRSPLARQQVAIALARQKPERIEAALERIERESGRLDELVGEILTLARLEAGAQPPEDEYVDLLALFETVIDDARFEAEQNGRSLEAQGPASGLPLILRARGELLHRALENIVRNAIHHSPVGSKVEVRCASQAEQLSITVADCGAGVPERELETIFEPFFRSANSQSSGYGLGLAIARRAVEAHGGQIRARNRAEGGLEIELMLPLRGSIDLPAGE